MANAYKIIPYWTAFLHNIKSFRKNSGIQLNKSILVVEQNSYLTKIVIAYFIYNLDNWPRNSLNKFRLKNAFLVQLI